MLASILRCGVAAAALGKRRTAAAPPAAVAALPYAALRVHGSPANTSQLMTHASRCNIQGKGDGQQGGSAAGGPRAAGAATHADPVLEQLLRHVRSKHVRRHFFARGTAEYTEPKDIRVLTGTYNVGGRRPAGGQTLDGWLHQWKDSWPAVSRARRDLICNPTANFFQCNLSFVC